MKNLSLILLLFCLAPSLTFAKVMNKKNEQFVEIDLKKYIDFSLEWTSYKYNGETLPKVKIEKDALVQIFAYGEYEYAQAEAKGIQLSQVNAIYLVDTKTIYISDKIDLKDPKLEITLVHEIVHYLQDINGYTKSVSPYLACTESEAYDVQSLWQTMNKVDTESLPFVYQMSLISAMKCMGSKSSALGLKSRYDQE